MPFGEFKKYFTDFQVCMIEDDFKYTSVRSQCAHNRPQFFKMRITKESIYYITVN
jgi:hypothetical protein